ncbi:integrase core domain-containing protein [Rubripirellula amarantea]|nr:integrase core domain-containing protein [Rubripirellula amarantea]
MNESRTAEQAERILPFFLQPWFLIAASFAGMMTRHSEHVIVFQAAQIRVLLQFIRSKGHQRILLNDRQRSQLAKAGKPLGRKVIGECCPVFTPDTILRWHRELVAQHHTHGNQVQSRSSGRPPLSPETVMLVLRLANENASWGADRIEGELKKLGVIISDTSVENILKDHGIDPESRRKECSGTWAEFLKAHWECLAATDFTTVDVWTPTGLKTIYLLFVIELKSRRVQFVGSTQHPNERWMLAMVDRVCVPEGILGGEYHATMLILDNDTKFSKAFKSKLKDRDVQPKHTGVGMPNMNAYMERFIGSYKRECADRMVFFGEQMLQYATNEYLAHYHQERPHQGLDNELIIPMPRPPDPEGAVVLTKRLGGLLKSYQRAAA